MPPTDIAVTSNARMVTRVEYGIDPRGWSWAARLNAVLQGGISGRSGRRVLPGNATFHGVVQSPQNFAGAAALGMGGARPVVGRSVTLDNVSGATAAGDPGLAVFAERMRRRR